MNANPKPTCPVVDTAQRLTDAGIPPRVIANIVATAAVSLDRHWAGAR